MILRMDYVVHDNYLRLYNMWEDYRSDKDHCSVVIPSSVKQTSKELVNFSDIFLGCN